MTYSCDLIDLVPSQFWILLEVFDKKGDGRVSTKELEKVFKSLALQINDEQLKEWADEMDEEAEGYLIWDQFKVLFERKIRMDEDERELREAFRVLDKGNKGTIPVEDLRWILKSIGDDFTEEELDDMIAETDTDGSGTVDYEEFKTLMTSDWTLDTVFVLFASGNTNLSYARVPFVSLLIAYFWRNLHQYE